MSRLFQTLYLPLLACLALGAHGLGGYALTTTTLSVPEPTSASSFRAAGGSEQPSVLPDAYIVRFEGGKSFDNAFLDQVEGVTGSKTTLRSRLLGDLFNAVSIQLDSEPTDVDAAEVIATLPGVAAVDPIRVHSRPKIDLTPVDGLPTLLKRQSPVADNLSAYDTMTQVDKLKSMGYNGSGIRIGIIDAPVDYTHPALGGCRGPGCLVAFYRDWLDPVDVHNATADCKSHATALAGVIAAQPNPVGFTGVAPGVQLGSYGISGCTVGGNDEKLLDAIQQGILDGMDILVYSLGFNNGWTTLTLNLAFDALIEKGIMLVGAAGNSGSSGIFDTIHPADSLDVLGVGAVDPIQTIDLANLSTATIAGKSSDFAWRDGEAGTPNTVGWKNTVLPLWANPDNDLYANGCKPLPANAPDLSKHIVLMRRHGCSDQTIAENAKNAKYLIIAKDNTDLVIEVPRVTQSSIQAIAMVDGQTATSWVQALQAGEQVSLNMTFDPFKRRQLVEKNGNGGKMSSFTEWGPTFDGYMAPNVAAPGSGLLTTTPVGPGEQEYATVSGTSVAGPYAAGVAALVAQVRKVKDWKTLSSLLATTAQPLKPVTVNTDIEFASVAQQGGGLVQAYNAAFAPGVLSVKALNFNDTAHRKNLTFSITNTSPKSITFDLNHIPAGSVYTFKEDDLNNPGKYDDITNELYTKDAGVLTFTPSKITVPPNGGSAEVEVQAKAPKLNQTRLGVFSGWVALNGSNGFDFTLPYMGIAGSLNNTRALHSLLWRLTDPSPAPGAEPRPIIPVGRVVHLPDEVPILQVSIGMGLRSVKWDVVDATSGKVLGEADLPSFDRASHADYLVTWQCQFANGTKLPTGKYKLNARSWKTFAKASDKDEDYLALESAELDIAWT